MKTELLVKELPFEIPVEELTKISGIKDLSSKLNLIRRWVHFNQDITHEKRLIWHQSVVDLAKKNKLLELEARSLGNIAKIYDRLGQFDHSLTSSKIAEKIWIKLSRDDNKYLHNLIITYCDLAVTYRLENKIEEAFEILYKGYKIIKIMVLIFHLRLSF